VAKKWIYLIIMALTLGALYLVREILLPFLLSGVLIYLLAPGVDYLADSQRKFPLPRGAAVALMYVLCGAVLTGVFFLLLPPLYTEFIRIVQQIPVEIGHFRTDVLPRWMTFIEAWNQRFDLNMDLQRMTDETLNQGVAALKHEIEVIPHRLQGIFEGIMKTLSSFLVIFIVTGFVLVDLPQIKQNLRQLLPLRHRDQILALVAELNKDLGGTIRGQLTICLINGVLTTIGLLLLQVKFAVTIGFIAGIFSLIPVFGALISSIPAVFIGLTQSLWTAFAIVIMIIGIHLLEANVLNPKILGHTVELHPAVIVFAIIAGEHFFGAIGLLFAVPVAAIARSILKFVYQNYLIEQSERDTIFATEVVTD
jgi:putative heme transporter